MATKTHDETQPAAGAAGPASENGADRPIDLRSRILARVTSIPEEAVEVPEWEATVLVRGLTGTERDSMDLAAIQGKGKNREYNLVGLRGRMVARTSRDPETGKRIFRDEDAEALSQGAAAPLERVFEVALRLSGMTKEDVEELTEELKGDPSAQPGSN
jgi:hypothetical protein